MKTIIIKNIRLPFTIPMEEAVDTALCRLKKAGVYAHDAYIYKKSVDARRKDDICFVYSVAARCEHADDAVLRKLDAAFEKEEWTPPVPGTQKLSNVPIICGFGPAGMFAALLLAENGYRPLVLERGSDVNTRRLKVEKFMKTGILDTECNIQFGAGGAGTFSDGKLVTRINDPACRYIFSRLCEFGAPPEIMYDAKPHIGTDKLLDIVDKISMRITELGGTVLYNTAMRGIVKKQGRVTAVVTDRGEIEAGALILALGNSSRDTYRYMMREGYDIINKPFSVGVRIEHLREDVDRALYGKHAGDTRLGAASYAFSHREGNRGVYTFCMCPGGEVIAAASANGMVVTNGMSRYARDGRNSNAAVAVSVESDNPIQYQEMLESAAFAAGGGEYYAPVQSVGDFIDGTLTALPTRIRPTYMGGKVRNYNLCSIFTPDIQKMLRLGITSFDRHMKGFAARDAILTGVETRTSAPVRIVRGEDCLASGTDNLYPCGEGAGYAGGITSAAADGLRCASRLIERYERIEN